jgi:hypothetical protein
MFWEPLGRLRKRWNENIYVDLRELNCKVGRQMKIAQNNFQWQASSNSKTLT